MTIIKKIKNLIFKSGLHRKEQMAILFTVICFALSGLFLPSLKKNLSLEADTFSVKSGVEHNDKKKTSKKRTKIYARHLLLQRTPLSQKKIQTNQIRKIPINLLILPMQKIRTHKIKIRRIHKLPMHPSHHKIRIHQVLRHLLVLHPAVLLHLLSLPRVAAVLLRHRPHLLLRQKSGFHRYTKLYIMMQSIRQ